MLPHFVTYNTYMWSVQYKISNDVLFLNKKLQNFGIKPSSLCLFCNFYDKTSFHIFYERDHVKCLWWDLVQCFQNSLILPTLTPQTAIFGILDFASDDSIFKNNKVFINHILLIFKLCLYKSREKNFINLNNLIAAIWKVKRLEKEAVLTTSMKAITFTKKWYIINNILL